MAEERMYSLYDYMGHAAGQSLGKEVAKAAKKLDEPTALRWVKNKKYVGWVVLYRRTFLEDFFNNRTKYNSVC